MYKMKKLKQTPVPTKSGPSPWQSKQKRRFVCDRRRSHSGRPETHKFT